MQTVSILLSPRTFNAKLIDCLNEITLEFGKKNIWLLEPNENEAYRLFEIKELWPDDKDLIQNICSRFDTLPIFIHGEDSLSNLKEMTEITLHI